MVYVRVTLVQPYIFRSSSAPRVHRTRWPRSFATVGIAWVHGRHRGGLINRYPSVFMAMVIS